jgi:hypothetical protein
MSADVYYLPPRCPACHRPMELIHVLADNRFEPWISGSGKSHPGAGILSSGVSDKLTIAC